MVEETEEKLHTNKELGKNFWLVFIGSVVSQFGDASYNFAIYLYLLDLTGEALLSGVYLVVGMGTYFLFQLFGGAIVDRINKVRVMFITDYLRGIVMFGGWLCIILVTDTMTKIYLLMVIALLISILGSLFGPASSSLIPFIVKRDNLQKANSYMSIKNSLLYIIGIAIGSAMYDALGIELIFIINGISYIASGFTEMFIHIEGYTDIVKAKIGEAVKHIFTDIKEGFKYAVIDRPLLTLAIFALFINFAFSPLFATIIPYLFQEVLKMNAKSIAGTEIAMMIGSLIIGIILSIKAHPDKINKILKFVVLGWIILFIIIACLTFSVINSSISLILFYIITLALMFIAGLLSGLINVPLQVVFQKRIDPNYLGRVGTMFSMSAMALQPIAILIIGYLIDDFEATVTIRGMGIVYTMAITTILSSIVMVFMFINKPLRDI